MDFYWVKISVIYDAFQSSPRLSEQENKTFTSERGEVKPVRYTQLQSMDSYLYYGWWIIFQAEV